MAENALLSDGSTNNKKDPLIEGGMTVQRSAQCVQIVWEYQLQNIYILALVMNVLEVANITHQAYGQLTCVTRRFGRYYNGDVATV